MPTVTVAATTTKAQQFAGMENHAGITTAEWLSLYNSAGSRVYRALVKHWGYDRFETETAFTINANAAYLAGPGTYLDPTAWIALLGVQLTTPGGSSMAIGTFTQVDRDRKTWGGYADRRSNVRYRAQGQKLMFEPANVANGWAGIVRYVADWADLAGGGSMDFRISGADDAVAELMAYRARRKLRLDASDLRGEVEAILADLDSVGFVFNRGAAVKQPRRAGW